MKHAYEEYSLLVNIHCGACSAISSVKVGLYLCPQYIKYVKP